jgi:Protein of unknown function (DUF2442)
MKSANTGADISAVEVLNVSPLGFWLLAGGREYYLAFSDFPWFRNATLQQLFKVEFSHGDHLYWPELDLDLECIEHPEKFPLVAK